MSQPRGKDPITRLSKPELASEVWVGDDSSWLAVGTKHPSGSHKEWIIVCLKDNDEFSGGDVLEDTYPEWYQARYALIQLVRKSIGGQQ